MAAALFASKYYPAPVNANLVNNAVNERNQAYNTDQGDARIDWNITQRDRLSARYSQSYQDDRNSNSQLVLGNFTSKFRFPTPSGPGPTRWARTY